MLALINWRIKVTINDGRQLVGQMLAFDRHMNLVLAECEEFRRIRPKKKPGQETQPEQEVKRALGLVILRGETVVSLSVESPPPVQEVWIVHHPRSTPVCITPMAEVVSAASAPSQGSAGPRSASASAPIAIAAKCG